MATYSTNGPIAHTTNANFQAWVNEIYTGLVTQCGLTQTADTGQMAVPCVSAIPGTNAYAGYYVFAFNDTLQATAPIVFRLDFGTAASGGIPNIGLTIGTASNGSGTITGVGTALPAKLGLGDSTGPGASLYNSYFCYYAPQGSLWFSFKLGAPGANTVQMMLGIFRTVGTTGTPTGDGLYVVTLSQVAGAGTYGATSILNYNTSAVQYGPTYWFSAGNGTLTAVPFSEASTVLSGTGQVFPIWQWKGNATTPGVGITNFGAVAFLGELPTGTTVTLNILGSVSLTYISMLWGGYAPVGAFGLPSTSYTNLLIWQ